MRQSKLTDIAKFLTNFRKDPDKNNKLWSIWSLSMQTNFLVVISMAYIKLGADM